MTFGWTRYRDFIVDQNGNGFGLDGDAVTLVTVESGPSREWVEACLQFRRRFPTAVGGLFGFMPAGGGAAQVICEQPRGVPVTELVSATTATGARMDAAAAGSIANQFLKFPSLLQYQHFSLEHARRTVLVGWDGDVFRDVMVRIPSGGRHLVQVPDIFLFPPELLKGLHVDARAPVQTAAVLFVLLCAGRAPYVATGPEPMNVYHSIVAGNVDAAAIKLLPSSIRESVGAALAPTATARPTAEEFTGQMQLVDQGDGQRRVRGTVRELFREVYERERQRIESVAIVDPNQAIEGAGAPVTPRRWVQSEAELEDLLHHPSLLHTIT